MAMMGNGEGMEEWNGNETDLVEISQADIWDGRKQEVDREDWDGVFDKDGVHKSTSVQVLEELVEPFGTASNPLRSILDRAGSRRKGRVIREADGTFGKRQLIVDWERVVACFPLFIFSLEGSTYGIRRSNERDIAVRTQGRYTASERDGRK